MSAANDRVRFRDAAVAAALNGALFFAVYGFCNWRASTLASVPSIVFDWERAIPFLPWMIVPYMSIDILFAGAFFLCATRREMRTLSRRILWAMIVSSFFFLLMPLRVSFDRPATEGLPGFLLAVLEVDAPFNQFPSLHVSLALVLVATYLRRSPPALRPVITGWFALIIASTLFVYQHHAIDLAGGAVVGLSAFTLFREQERHRAGTSPSIGLLYAGGSLALLVPALLWPVQAWWTVWPSISCLVVAAGYLVIGPEVLGKRRGEHGVVHRLLLAPYLLGCELSHRFFRRRVAERVEVAPGVWLGRRLTRQEARRLVRDGFGAVIDLAGELPRRAELDLVDVLDLPLLDFTVPEPRDLQRCVEFIERHRERGVPVFIHCALGCTRGVVVTAAWLLHADPELDPGAAIERLRSLRPALRLDGNCVGALAELARSRRVAPRGLDLGVDTATVSASAAEGGWRA